MICDQYIDIPKGEWTQIPSNATGFCFLLTIMDFNLDIRAAPCISSLIGVLGVKSLKKLLPENHKKLTHVEKAPVKKRVRALVPHPYDNLWVLFVWLKNDKMGASHKFNSTGKIELSDRGKCQHKDKIPMERIIRIN